MRQRIDFDYAHQEVSSISVFTYLCTSLVSLISFVFLSGYLVSEFHFTMTCYYQTYFGSNVT